MDFQDLIRRRYSVRAYDPRPVEEEKLARVLEAACLAPSACNRQPFRIVVVPTRGRVHQLQLFNFDFQDRRRFRRSHPGLAGLLKCLPHVFIARAADLITKTSNRTRK